MGKDGQCCVLTFDEMSLKTELAYDCVRDTFDGSVELPEKRPTPCNEALVFMARPTPCNEALVFMARDSPLTGNRLWVSFSPEMLQGLRSEQTSNGGYQEIT